MKHSSDASFRKNCKRLLKAIVKQHSSASSKAFSTVCAYLASIKDDIAELPQTVSKVPTMTDEEALNLSMELLYRTRITNPHFKGLMGRDLIDSDAEDDLDLELFTQAVIFVPEDDGSQDFDWFQPARLEPILCASGTMPKVTYLNEANWSDEQGFWSAEEDPWGWSSPTSRYNNNTEPLAQDEMENRIDGVRTLDGLTAIDGRIHEAGVVVNIEDFEAEGEDVLLDFDDELDDFVN